MLRPATTEDAKAITAVFIHSRRTFISYAPIAHTESEISTWIGATLIPSGSVVVWEAENQVVGFIATSVDDNSSWIDQLYVLPDWTGSGIGNKLLQHAQRSLARPIKLYTFQQNMNARSFYEHHGYKAIKFSSGENNEEGCPDVLYELSAPEPEA
jgi:ribosomal protein S18 acetylase RimI-like enzyme